MTALARVPEAEKLAGRQVNVGRQRGTIDIGNAVVVPYETAEVPTAGVSNSVADLNEAGWRTSAYYEPSRTYDIVWVDPSYQRGRPLGKPSELLPANFGSFRAAFWPTTVGDSFALVSEALTSQTIAYFDAFSDLGNSVLSFSPVNVDPVHDHRELIGVLKRSRTDMLAGIRRQLDVAKAERAQEAPRDVVLALTLELGVGQLLAARAVGVSPTAIRKWRRGDQARPARRAQLAQFAAMCDLLRRTDLHDPAGWLEIPISSDSTLTPLDLYVEGRADLVVALANRLSDPHETLDAFDREWRVRFPIDREYEVITLDDGSRSAVPRLESRQSSGE